MDYKRMETVFKALCDENRLQILQLLQPGERCACRLLEAMQITQPTLSHHMKILCDSGIVVGRKEGKWMYYSVSEEGVEVAAKYLSQLVKSERKEEDGHESCRESGELL